MLLISSHNKKEFFRGVVMKIHKKYVDNKQWFFITGNLCEKEFPV